MVAETPEPVAQPPSSYRKRPQASAGAAPARGDVLGTLARGCSEAELLGDFPQLTHEDVLACFAFAPERERRQMVATQA